MKNLFIKSRLLDRKGFTLVELLVAMTVFIMFIGVVIGSYMGLVRSQREANEYRIMYSEARNVFDSLAWEMRNGTVDYRYYHDSDTEGILTKGLSEVVLISKDADERTFIRYENEAVYVQSAPFNPDDFAFSPPLLTGESVPLNDPGKVKISAFEIYISPVFDPYNQDSVYHDFQQFQPKITIYAEFERDSGIGRTYEMSLQTTVSSRVYNQVY